MISRRSKQRAKKVNQALLLSVESRHNLIPKNTVEVENKWVKVRVTMDSGAAGHVMPETMFPHVKLERNADGVFRAREIRRLESQDRWDTKAINSVIGVPWRMTDGKWTVDRPAVRVDPIPIPPLLFERAGVQRERITKQDIDEFGATIGCPGCNAIKDNKRAQVHSDRCRARIEECLRTTSHGAERLDRRK